MTDGNGRNDGGLKKKLVGPLNLQTSLPRYSQNPYRQNRKHGGSLRLPGIIIKTRCILVKDR